VTTTLARPQMSDPRAEGAGARRPPASRLGATVLLVLLGGFGVTRFIAADTPPRNDLETRIEPIAASADDLATLEAAVATNPGDLTSLQALGVAHLRSASDSNLGAYAQAEATFDRADAIAPGDPVTLVGRAMLANVLHRFRDGGELARRALANSPDLDVARVVLVDSLIETGDYESAERELRRLVETEAGASVLTRVSYLRELNGDLAGSIEAMRSAVTATTGFGFEAATIRQLLGGLKLQQGDSEGARREFERALELAPDLPLAVVGLARVEISEGRLGVARARLETFTANSGFHEAVELLGHLQTGRERAATFARLRQLVSAARDAGEVVDSEFSRFEADYGDPAEALRLAERGYRERPRHVGAIDALAWSRFRGGDVAGARALLDDARRLGTPNADLRWHAAAIYAASGEIDEATTELRAVIAAGPAFVFGQRAEVVELAVDLGIAAPDHW